MTFEELDAKLAELYPDQLRLLRVTRTDFVTRHEVVWSASIHSRWFSAESATELLGKLHPDSIGSVTPAPAAEAGDPRSRDTTP